MSTETDCKWLPIETAPKTTKSILVHCYDIRCTFAVTWEADTEYGKGRGWLLFGGYGEKLSNTPTHWRPMVNPPTALSREPQARKEEE